MERKTYGNNVLSLLLDSPKRADEITRLLNQRHHMCTSAPSSMLNP
jgi:hypothetical protein